MKEELEQLKNTPNPPTIQENVVVDLTSQVTPLNTEEAPAGPAGQTTISQPEKTPDTLLQQKEVILLVGDSNVKGLDPKRLHDQKEVKIVGRSQGAQ